MKGISYLFLAFAYGILGYILYLAFTNGPIPMVIGLVVVFFIVFYLAWNFYYICRFRVPGKKHLFNIGNILRIKSSYDKLEKQVFILTTADTMDTAKSIEYVLRKKRIKVLISTNDYESNIQKILESKVVLAVVDDRSARNKDFFKLVATAKAGKFKNYKKSRKLIAYLDGKCDFPIGNDYIISMYKQFKSNNKFHATSNLKYKELVKEIEKSL